MIHFNFEIRNPFKWRTSPFTNFNICRWCSLSKHKVFEWQFARWEVYNLFEFDLNLIWWGRDHAGPELSIEFLGIRFDIKISHIIINI